MKATHACVWIDHREARVFGISRGPTEEIVVHDRDAPRQVHHKANTTGSGKADPDHAFFDNVAALLGRFKGILVAGPGTARTEFSGYLAQHYPAIAKRVWGIEPMDHPSERQIAASARKFFDAATEMRP